MKVTLSHFIALALFLFSVNLTAQEEIEETVTSQEEANSSSDTAAVNAYAVEKMALAPDCDEDASHQDIFNCFSSFITSHIVSNFQFPEEARRAGKGGRVWIQFVIETDGSISNVKVARSSGVQSIDEEGLRVMRALPDMDSPAYLNGNPVRMMYNVPINAASR